jgi:hypothetical protein
MAQVTITHESAVLLHELWEGLHTEHGDTRDENELVDDAIKRVHRGFFGLANGSEGGPERPTGPFRKWASDRWAEVLLRQVDAKQFRLSQPFRYDNGARHFDVPEDDVTDLASVPRFLTWLVPRYGRHTLAALLHDHLQDVPTVTGEQADELFRDAMGDTEVPLLRRWLMWSAVALRTQWNIGGLRKLRVLLWVAVFGLFALVVWPVAMLMLAFAFGRDALAFAAGAVVLAVALPVALSWLWGRRWKIGALAGVALTFFTVQVVLVLFALVVYVGVEWLVEHVVVRKPDRNPVLTRNLV